MSRRKLLLPGAMLVLALATWALVQTRGASFHADQARVAPSAPAIPHSAASTDRPLAAGSPAVPAGGGDAAPREEDPGADSLAEIIEAEAGQLTDLLSHLRSTCAAARANGGAHVAIAAATRCVEDAEAAMSTVELLRGSIASPAGAGMPMEVRSRWDATLREATATVRQMLGPLWDEVGRALSSASGSPPDFRALGHLRDRIGRVLSEVERP